MSNPKKDDPMSIQQLHIRNFGAKRQALVEGRIRAIIKPLREQPPEGFIHRGKAPLNGVDIFTNDNGQYFFPKSVYWPGDLLYIRESCAIKTDASGHPYYAYQIDHQDDQKTLWFRQVEMPREAARYFFTVESTEIMQIQDISKEDAMASGVSGRGWKATLAKEWDDSLTSQERKADLMYQRNPWVQVVRFKTCPRPSWWPTGVSEKFSHRLKQKKTYIVRDAATGEIITTGTAQECAETLGYTTSRTIYVMANNTKAGKSGKYIVEEAIYKV